MDKRVLEIGLAQAVRDGNISQFDADELLNEWEDDDVFPKYVIYEVATPANSDPVRVASVCGKLGFAGDADFTAFDSIEEAERTLEYRGWESEYWTYVVVPVRSSHDMEKLVSVRKERRGF